MVPAVYQGLRYDICPINRYAKKGVKFSVSEKAREAFVLRHADFSKRFFIQCDASEYGIGAVLLQLNDTGAEHPIAFYSHNLNAYQRNYSVTEKECLAAVMAIKKFRPYVELMQFTVITDHASLQWLMNLKGLSGKLARWSLQLQGYNFDIQHRKGKENIVADMLSRLPTVEELYLEPALDLEADEFECEEYRELRQNIKANQKKLPDLRIVEHLVFKRGHVENNAELHEFQWKLWVPESLTHKLIWKAHDDVTSAHGGISKTINRLKEKYYWPNMSSQVRQYVSNCRICKETKPVNQHTQPTIGNEVVTDRSY